MKYYYFYNEISNINMTNIFTSNTNIRKEKKKL